MPTVNTGNSPIERVVMRRADGSPITVLVVDDEPALAELVSMALRYEGWNVVTAATGRPRSPGRGRRGRMWSCWM